MSSSVVDTLYCIRCTHLMTGGVFQMPSWDLGLSPCHFLAGKVEVSGIGTASHAHTHTHTHTHTHKCKQASCNAHLQWPKCYVHIRRVISHVQTHTHTHRYHSPCRLSSRIIFWMSSSVVDTLYCIRCTHLMTGECCRCPVGIWDFLPVISLHERLR